MGIPRLTQREELTKSYQDLKSLMLAEFGHYHPSLTHIIK